MRGEKLRHSVQKVVPSHHYESDIYQSVEIYQTKNRFLSWYYWGRVTTAVGMLLDILESTRGGHALDLGCGSGMTLPTLQKCFVEVTAADVYTEHARRVIELEGLEGVNLFASDGGALPFEDESFDQVLLFDLLEHVEGNKGQVIDECWRVLRRGGYVACSFPVEVGPVVFLLRWVGASLDSKGTDRVSLRRWPMPLEWVGHQPGADSTKWPRPTPTTTLTEDTTTRLT